MLVSIYGSCEMFVAEYRSLLADRLLQSCTFDISREVNPYGYAYTYTCTCMCMNDQLLRQGKAKQLPLEDNSLFPREEEELPQMGFEPTMLCLLDKHSTN